MVARFDRDRAVPSLSEERPMKLPIDFDFLPDHDCEQEAALLTCLMEAHRRATRDNQNISKIVATTVYQTSGSFVQALAAGVLTVGGIHAPVEAARRDFCEFEPEVYRLRIRSKERLAGLGNDFYKDRIDPAFQPVMVELERHWPDAFARLQAMSKIAFEEKKLFLNAALLTAACCEICKVPPGIEYALLFVARMPVWATACSQVPRVQFK
jgi:hypothetical protein